MLTKLGKYEIKRELGRGAMGIVYEGFDPFIERTVAIKTISKSLIDPSEAEDALSRFRREAQAAGRLTHPNIVSVYEYGEQDDFAFIAMEFITGKELKSYFEKTQRFQLRDSLNIMQQLLDALEYSHERGVVHRDIKPSNIIITQNNRIKVVDFGIARIESSDLTQAGMVLGTPAYMSPEQFKGLVVDRRSDIYSTGVILYQFLTGSRPFMGNPTTLMHKVLCQNPVPPSEINPEISKPLEGVVTKAMSRQPEDRFQTAAEFSRALKAASSYANDSGIPASEYEETLVLPRNSIQSSPEPQNSQGSSPNPALSFDLEALSTHIEKRLEEVRRDRSLETSTIARSEFETMLVVKPEMPKPIPDISENSVLLAGLASESMVSDRQQQRPQVQKTVTQRVQDALQKVSRFLESFALQLRKTQPPIMRNYVFGRRATFSNLICKNAHADSRKQSISETALLDYVFLSVSLCAPAPLVISRPRDMLVSLKEQLDKVKLRSPDNLLALSKGQPDEWVEIHLAADFPMQIQFKGNPEEACLDVYAVNIETFGQSSFKLKIEDISAELMDGIGLFLLARTDKLPQALQRI